MVEVGWDTSVQKVLTSVGKVCESCCSSSTTDTSEFWTSGWPASGATTSVNEGCSCNSYVTISPDVRPCFFSAPYSNVCGNPDANQFCAVTASAGGYCVQGCGAAPGESCSGFCVYDVSAVSCPGGEGTLRCNAPLFSNTCVFDE